ncbi:MAG: right-handed parallel beta-helix repeat-containing protein [Nitrososphaerota archaeon]|nr:right-handed parallel beta-helix repeat-containing protein [Nitrososphaerota archaeon]
MAFSSLSLLLLFVLPAFPAAAAATATSDCVSAGSTGLTTVVVAFAGETISGSVNATGCDLGVYVPPGANGVMVTHAVITGANEHAILAQNVVGFTLRDSVITGNGLAVNPKVPDSKAVELVGTANSTVISNTIVANGADGGIALTDDGPVNPGALSPGVLSASVGNVVEFNFVNDTSPANCGIVLAGFNAGAGVRDNLVLGNTILGNSPKNPGPGDGQIVIASDGPGVTISDNAVQANTIDGSLLPGIVVHSNAPGDVISGTDILNNNIINNGGYPVGGPFTSANDPVTATGIAVIAEAAVHEPNPPTVTGTNVLNNLVTGDVYGIWTCQTTQTTVVGLIGNSQTNSTSCPAGP